LDLKQKISDLIVEAVELFVPKKMGFLDIPNEDEVELCIIKSTKNANYYFFQVSV